MQFTDFSPGVYRVLVSRLNVRGTPDASHNGNLVKGVVLTQGKTFPVFSITSDKLGWVWGVVTDNSANQTHYVCLWNINTLFAEYVSPLLPPSKVFPQREEEDSILKLLYRIDEKLDKLLLKK